MAFPQFICANFILIFTFYTILSCELSFSDVIGSTLPLFFLVWLGCAFNFPPRTNAFITLLGNPCSRPTFSSGVTNPDIGVAGVVIFIFFAFVP